MEFIIKDRFQISNFVLGDRLYGIISITDPVKKFPNIKYNSNLVDVLGLWFSGECSRWAQIYGRDGLLFNEDQAREIIQFYYKYENHISTLVCQSDCGVSRGPAVAAVLSLITNNLENHKEVMKNKKYEPNMCVYKTLLKVYLKG